MQVTMHVVLDNLAELTQFAKVLSHVATNTLPAGAKAAAAIEDIVPPKKTTFEQQMKAKAEPAVAKPTKTDVETAPVEEKSPSPLDPTYDNMKGAVLLVSKTKGRVAAVTILKKYDTDKIGPHIEEKNFASIISDCYAALA